VVDALIAWSSLVGPAGGR